MSLSVMSMLAVAVGGGVGALTRYVLAHQLHLWLGYAFPWGTLTVNVLGSLAIGLMLVMLQEWWQAAAEWRLLLVVGFLGGFTTFSSFSWDTYALWMQGKLVLAVANVLANVVVCLLATALGVWLARLLHPMTV